MAQASCAAKAKRSGMQRPPAHLHRCGGGPPLALELAHQPGRILLVQRQLLRSSGASLF